MIGQTISAEVGWPDSAVALKVAHASALAGLAMSGRHSAVSDGCALAPGTPGSCLQHCLASLICIPTCIATKWPSSPCQPERLAASASRLHQAALTEKSADPEQQAAASVHCHADICPARYNPALKGG